MELELNAATQVYAGNVDTPKFLGAGATYLDIFILNLAAIVALTCGLIARYRHYAPERNLLKQYNKEGRTVFFDDFGGDD